MSWFPEEERRTTNWFTKFCSNVLKCGPVPKHVAFIMDGNRRFARKSHIQRHEGHVKGFDKLADTLEWCLDLGITEVSVYAFSIENFKRSKDEVDGLMELARQKFARLMEEKDSIQKYGVCVRVLGDISMLPKDVQELISEAVEFSKNNDRAILNVCFAYTSRHEMTTAVKELATGVEEGLLRPSDVSEHLLEKCLYTSHSADPDLLVRTSGEVRLSDFLLWQSSYSVLSFVKVLWPEFSIWHLFAAVLHYQRNYQAIQKGKEANLKDREAAVHQSDHQCVLEEIEKEQVGSKDCKNTDIQSRIRKYRLEREERERRFLDRVYERRRKSLESMLPVKISISY
ncbi:dehydrodolichyl diphosphate synthase complex subunit DHDDS-like isoform X1 [Ptychodera flava]|uniref:dehydrodolichyl diphosphate synthase complex subunit DHDDS-like isoform X1 n=1 Tax=Ptychodera flava TaxID=63121 RepID=UPI003969DCEF